jgi:hypothetical protein
MDSEMAALSPTEEGVDWDEGLQPHMADVSMNTANPTTQRPEGIIFIISASFECMRTCMQYGHTR